MSYLFKVKLIFDKPASPEQKLKEKISFRMEPYKTYKTAELYIRAILLFLNVLCRKKKEINSDLIIQTFGAH